MHAADKGTEDIQGVHRVALAVKDQVGGIQIDEQVIKADGFEQTAQHDGGLLAGFKQQILAVALQIPGDGLDRGHNAGPGGIGHVLRDEAHVGHDVRDTQQTGVGRAVDQVLHPYGPPGQRHDAQGLRPLGEIPEFRAFPAAPEGGDFDAEFLRQRFHLFRVFRGPVHRIPADQLTVTEAPRRGVGKVFAEVFPAAVADDDSNVHTVSSLFNCRKRQTEGVRRDTPSCAQFPRTYAVLPVALIIHRNG